MNALVNSFTGPQTRALPDNGWLRLATYSLTVAIPASPIMLIPPVQIPVEARDNASRGTTDRNPVDESLQNVASAELRHILFAPLPAGQVEVSAAIDGALRAALRSSTTLVELL